MAEIIKEAGYLWKKKCFAVGIPLMMFLSYCTLLFHPTIGIDDTSFKLYYVDGVSPAMGRWCLYLINKILPLDYNPVFVEAVGLLCFCISVSLWCVVFYRLFGETVSPLGYTIFGCVMLSSPIISEVVVWYLQDGIYLGYGVTALAVLFAMDVFRTDKGISLKKRLGKLLASAFFLTVALGFYEAFMIVFMMGVVMVFLVIRVTECRKYSKKPLEWFLNMGIVVACAMVFRTVVIQSVIAFYQLEDQTKVLASRNAGDILQGLLGWFDGTKEVSFSYMLKDFFVKYVCNAVVYVPVAILVLAAGVLVLWGILKTIRKKDGWIFLSVLGILILPLILPVLEGVATYYRSSEYVPLLTAFSVLLLIWEIRKIPVKAVRTAGFLLALLLLYRQGYEMNRWLYVDAMKYENDKLVMSSVALDIIRQCDETKPVCVIGSYQTPESLIEDVYCPTWSRRYDLVKFLVEAVDPKLFEKYDTPLGYAAAETPRLSYINWGAVAYYGFDRELVKFWKMHGFTFTEDGNLDHYRAAESMMQDGPVWPKEGSIVEMEDHIIVNFGNLKQ
ncbi:MAG: glucosyltransferase domain-containing protein [Lachnospiraceae bacterium]|nr:glucosyltransferase domain-containing protein [Lachnospiraceae bacterium]